MRENEERWKQLCAQAAVEQNPEKLLELTKEINRLLEEKRCRLNGPRSQGNGQTNGSKPKHLAHLVPQHQIGSFVFTLKSALWANALVPFGWN